MEAQSNACSRKVQKSKQADRHHKVMCKICWKKMRHNNLKRHTLLHKKKQIKEKAEEEEQKAQVPTVKKIAMEEGASPLCCYDELSSSEITIISPFDGDDLENDMLFDHQQYLKEIELGKTISIILDKGKVNEQSLTKERKNVLDLYRKNRPRFDVSSVELWSWQAQAFKLIETPSERQVIWIAGRKGGEGKSVLQRYIETYYGFHRVFCADLRIKHASVCNILKKQNLASIDIFLFNDARSVSGEELNMYRILEDIKDGQATASKYDNNNIRFKTPNTVMIFSNGYPNTKKLSRDRWLIYNANKDGLNHVTNQVLSMKKDGYNPHSVKHLKIYNL